MKRHSGLAAKSVETESKRDFMPLPCDSESNNEQFTLLSPTVILNLIQNLSILIKNIWHFWWQKCRKTIRHATFTNNLHGSTRKPANSLTLRQSRLLPYVSPAIIVHSAIAAKSLCHSELVSESLNTSTDSGSEAGMTGTESNIIHRKVRSD